MNQQTNNEFDKWFKKEFGEAYYPTEVIKLAWQAAKQQPMKRLSREQVYNVWIESIRTPESTTPYDFANAIMDEMERINHE